MKHPSTVCITGASNGIGASLALAYAEKNRVLYLIGRNEKRLAEVARKCESLGAKCHTEIVDVSKKSMIKRCILKFNAIEPIDLLIANAGVTSILSDNWQPEDEAALEAVLNTNFIGVINTVNAVVPLMIKRKKGQIAIMSSINAFRGLPHAPSYSASKAGIKVYGESLRGWLALYQIQVNVIFPGYVKTNMSDKLDVFKPLMLSQEKAAIKIKKGLKVNKANIIFPKTLYYLLRLLNFLPMDLFNAISLKIKVKYHPNDEQ